MAYEYYLPVGVVPFTAAENSEQSAEIWSKRPTILAVVVAVVVVVAVAVAVAVAAE